MSKPTIPSTTWASGAGALVTAPPTGLQSLGWAAGDQPAAAHMNWVINWMDQSIAWYDPFFGSTAGDLKATHLYPYAGTSTAGLTLNAGTSAGTNGVLVTGISNGIKFEVYSAGPTLEHSWRWAPDGTVTISATDSVDWGSTCQHKNLTAAASASTHLRYGYPSTDRPTLVYDVSPFMYPFTVPQEYQATSGIDPSAGTFQLHNYGGGTRSPRATAPLPRGALISDTSSGLVELTGLSALLTKDGTVTEVYLRVRRRTIGSWGTTANVATVSSATPTWSGSVVLDFSAYTYWLEFEADSANAGSGNGLTAARCTITLKPYGADV